MYSVPAGYILRAKVMEQYILYFTSNDKYQIANWAITTSLWNNSRHQTYHKLSADSGDK